jgi:hypothetical protein
MKEPQNVTGVVRTVVRTAIILAGLASLGACASIPQRAWANGRSMESSAAYYSVLNGNQSIQAHHELFWSLNQRVNYQKAYTPFGQWWY